jgi:outer membrane protein
MSYSLSKKLLFGALAPIVFASQCFAADISHSLRNNTQESDEPEDYFELGVAVGAGIGPSLTDEDGKGIGAGLVVNGSYNWNGFFVDVFGESRDPVVFGYNAYNADNWSFDVILAPLFAGFDEDTDSRFVGIDKRKSTMMLGGRLTGYWGKNIFQLTIKHDVTGEHGGTTASALIGQNWQYRNWNFHGMAGLAFSDSRINDYYLGITDAEAARTMFSAYDGNASYGAYSEVGVTYPITEDWIFRSTVRLGADLSDSHDSPLFVNDRAYWSSFNTSISYVF